MREVCVELKSVSVDNPSCLPSPPHCEELDQLSYELRDPWNGQSGYGKINFLLHVSDARDLFSLNS